MIRKVLATLGLSVALLAGWDSEPANADGPVLVKGLQEQRKSTTS